MCDPRPHASVQQCHGNWIRGDLGGLEMSSSHDAPGADPSMRLSGDCEQRQEQAC